MSIMLTLDCDGCSDIGFGGARGESAKMRREARDAGWRYIDGKDYCPTCRPAPREGGAVEEESMATKEGPGGRMRRRSWAETARAVYPGATEVEDLEHRLAALQAERGAAEARCGELEGALRAARSDLHDFSTNFDCDDDAHRYSTRCRACVAELAVGGCDTALARTPTQAAERVAAMEAVCEADRVFDAAEEAYDERDPDTWGAMQTARETRGQALAALARLDAAGGGKGPDAPAPDPPT